MSTTIPKTAITPRRDEDFPEWYQQVIRAAELAEPSDVRGCMVIRPWGYGIWENMQRQLDAMFQGYRPSERLFPAFHSVELFRQGSGARGRLRQGMRGRHAHTIGGGRRWKDEASQSIDGTACGEANFGNNHRRQLREMGSILPGPADPDQSMGKRRSVGDAAPPVSADN